MSIDIPNEMKEFLNTNGVMTLAVCDNQPWVCTLYYGLDENYTFYLVSDPDSKHGEILKNNKTVAFNIFDSHTKITESKKGIQGKGTCELVTDIKDLAKGILLWHKFNPGIEKNITLDDLRKIKDTKLFKITPFFLQFFNKEFYGKDQYGKWGSFTND